MKNGLGSLLLTLAAAAVSLGGAPGDEPKLDRLLVYGEGWAFSAQAPPGWVGDTQRAGDIGANVAFYRDGESMSSAVALIRIRVNPKMDENISADLDFDKDGYRKRFPSIAFRDLDVAHAKYQTVGSVFFVQGEFYEYVLYINPGKGSRWNFSASMNIQKADATPADLAAFRSIVRSIGLLGGAG